METRLKLDTAKTTFKLTRQAMDDLDFIVKKLGKTKKKVVDTIVCQMSCADGYGNSVTVHFVIMDAVRKAAARFDSEPSARAQYSLAQYNLAYLDALAKESGHSRAAILDAAIKVAKTMVTGERLKPEISRLTKKNQAIKANIGDIFDEVPLITWGEMLVDDYEELSHAWSDLWNANEKIEEILARIAAKENQPCA